MRKNLLLKLFVILNFYFLVNGNALAFYKPKLMVVEFTPVCSPTLLKNFHSLKTPEDLIHFPLLDDQDFETWQEWLEEAGVSEKIFKRRLRLRDSNVLIRSALDGHGIALSAVGIVQEYLDSGDLVRPFDISITLN